MRNRNEPATVYRDSEGVPVRNLYDYFNHLSRGEVDMSSAYVGCPSCKRGLYLKSAGVICPHCGTYFSLESSVEPDFIPRQSAAVFGEATQDRAAYRGSMEQMADDSKTGKAREKGASHYRDKYRHRDAFNKPPR